MDTPKPAPSQTKIDANPEEKPEGEGGGDVAAPINLQKRDYALDATRFGDWELNGRCVDF